jgi:pyruvate,orthophosphate dikinase
MRALALLGMAAEARLATALATSSDAACAALASLSAGHVSRSPRGLQLTAEGKGWLRTRLEAERARIDRDAADRLYGEFADADTTFKRIVTAWQVRQVDGRDVINDHSDADYDHAIRGRLGAFHAEAAPLVGAILALAPRLLIYHVRFDRAAAAIAAGDGTMIASPFKDSYHTIWFELHEELMHLAGRDRAAEEAAAGERAASRH